MLKSGSKAGLSGTSKMKSLECVRVSPREDRGGATGTLGTGEGGEEVRCMGEPA
jgi:hypothetical protein